MGVKMHPQRSVHGEVPGNLGGTQPLTQVGRAETPALKRLICKGELA
jgi:hypothetical protein